MHPQNCTFQNSQLSTREKKHVLPQTQKHYVCFSHLLHLSLSLLVRIPRCPSLGKQLSVIVILFQHYATIFLLQELTLVLVFSILLSPSLHGLVHSLENISQASKFVCFALCWGQVPWHIWENIFRVKVVYFLVKHMISLCRYDLKCLKKERAFKVNMYQHSSISKHHSA